MSGDDLIRDDDLFNIPTEVIEEVSEAAKILRGFVSQVDANQKTPNNLFDPALVPATPTPSHQPTSQTTLASARPSTPKKEEKPPSPPATTPGGKARATPSPAQASNAAPIREVGKASKEKIERLRRLQQKKKSLKPSR